MEGTIFSSKAPAMARIINPSVIGISSTEFVIHRNLLLTTHVSLPSIAAAESFEIRLQNGVAATLAPHRLLKWTKLGHLENRELSICLSKCIDY